MKQPPEVIQPLWYQLADITGWFNWEALSAIGTVGALWFVVVQTTRAGRAERARAVGILTYLIGLLEPVEIVSIYENTTTEDLKNMPSDELAQNLKIIHRAITGLDALPLPDASLVGVVEWVMATPISLKSIQEALLRRSVDGNPNNDIRYIQETVQHFRAERDKLRYGWFARYFARWRFGRQKS